MRANPQWEAIAYLKDSFHSRHNRDPYQLYGNCDGSGTASSRALACHIAVSEALEHWAWFTAAEEPILRLESGSDIDPSTSGWAAWPGTCVKRVRQNAYCEAVERWALQAWWNGLIPHEEVCYDDGAIRLLLPPGYPVVIVLHSSLPSGNHAYGFAAAPTLKGAVIKAQVELHRNQRILLKRNEQLVSDHKISHPTILYERRLQFFSSEDGHQRFKKRLAEKPPSLGLPPPHLLVDRRIEGPWDRYCRVWRCLLTPSLQSRTDEIDVFLF